MIAVEKNIIDKALSVLRENLGGLTLDQLYRRVEPSSQDDLNSAVKHLVSNEKVLPVIQVISPTTSTVIREYESIFEVPDKIADISSEGEIFIIDPLRDVKIKYAVRS